MVRFAGILTSLPKIYAEKSDATNQSAEPMQLNSDVNEPQAFACLQKLSLKSMLDQFFFSSILMD